MDKQTQDVSNAIMRLTKVGKSMSIFDVLKIFAEECGDNIKSVKMSGSKTVPIQDLIEKKSTQLKDSIGSAKLRRN